MSWFLSLTLAGTLAGGPSPNANAPIAVVSPSIADTAARMLAAENRRIRAAGPRVDSLIKDGIRRSRTFAGLVTDLHQTNVIVYVEPSMSLPAEVAGRILFAGAAGEQRYLRVQVRSTLTSNQMISVIAHELRHALEVAAEHSVVNDKALEAFYKRIGDVSHAGGGYDTEAARVAQRVVHRELNS